MPSLWPVFPGKLLSSRRVMLQPPAGYLVAARYVAVEYLALSPQCGFASTAAGNLLTEEQQWRKLRLVADTAGEVWGWG